MPKGRYRIMRDYMPKKGGLGLDMMLRTCTVQANLDYQSEADMVKKFRVSLALQPVAVALFANSPFTEGKPTGYQSYRSHVWTDIDPDRCGMLPFVFEDGFGFERYVDYMLDVPMYFVYRDGNYIDASGQSFRDFMAGRLPALPGEIPDDERLGRPFDHRLPRGAAQDLSRDARRRWRAVAAALRAAGAVGRAALRQRRRSTPPHDLVADWTAAEREAMRAEVPRLGLDDAASAAAPCATSRSKCSRSPAKGCTAAPGATLRRGRDAFPRHAVLDRRLGPHARRGTARGFNTRWGGDIDPVYNEYAY